jgi:hypothetical protein
MKDKMTENNEVYDNSDYLSDKISEIVRPTSDEAVKNLTFSSYIKEHFDNA